MPRIHLTNGETEEFEKVVVKEHGLVVGTGPRRSPQSAYPQSQVEEITDIEEIYDSPFLMEEEYGETRQARNDEPAEAVTEFENERRVMVDLEIE